MSERKISWYRSPVKREILAELNQRSDWKGFLYTFGNLGLLALTAGLSWYATIHWPVWMSVLLIFLHGTFFAFLLNAFHEFCHKTVFKTNFLNMFFLQLISFLSWYNPVLFWTSHQEHHKFTLHPPYDLEVVLPVDLQFIAFLKVSLINPWEFVNRLKGFVRISFGKLEGEWENALFPEKSVELRRSLFNWARLHLIGHTVIVVVSLYFGLWQIPILLTLAPFYAGGLQYLCNNAQHSGLQDNILDYRLCCRTIILNPFLSFLYWNMNYHTEHHMYAAVPCYNLSKLHAQIKSDLPTCPVGLVQTWKEIIPILKKQKIDPTYQYVAPLPSTARNANNVTG